MPWIIKMFLIVGAIVCLLLLLIFGFMLYPVSTYKSNDPVAIRYHDASRIGNALGHYQREQSGRLPLRLSELVPRYVASSNAAWFFGPTSSEGGINVAREIDYNGTFVYLGKRGFQENLVMYERTNLWPRDQDVASVVTLTTNFTARLLPAKDVEIKLSRLPPN